MQLLVFVYHFIFKLSYLNLYHLVGLLDLEVGDLRAKWLDLFSDLFDEFSSLVGVEFGRSRWHHDNLWAAILTSSTSRVQRTHLAVWHHDHLLSIGCRDDLTAFARPHRPTCPVKCARIASLPTVLGFLFSTADASTATHSNVCEASLTHRIGYRSGQNVFLQAMLGDILNN